MSGYIGVRCPVCNKKFAQADDIVVCPVCGAPHHRGCYAAKGACVFAADHLSGHEWRPPAPEPARESGTDGANPTSANPTSANPDAPVCPACKSPNPKGAFFCQICGRPLQYGSDRQSQYQGADPWGFPGFGGIGGDPSSFIYGGLSPDDSIDEIPARDLALYVGQNSGYYLAHFKRMDKTSRTLSFNFSSLIFGFLYFFYRKMYAVGGVLLALFVVSAIPSALQFREYLPQLLYLYGLAPSMPVNQAMVEHYQWLVNITGTINFLIGVIVSLCANRVYFIKAVYDVKKIRAKRADPPDERVYAETLARKGGISRGAVIAVACVIFAAYFICATVLLNQYMGGIA